MHVDNEFVEFVTAGEPVYEEIIEEYEEEILVQEGALELLATDFADTTPAQGKPLCITLILNSHWIYIYIYICVCVCVCDMYLHYMYFMETTCIDKLPMSPTSIGRVATMLRIFGSVSNLPLLTIGDYYYHSYDKMVKGKIETG